MSEKISRFVTVGKTLGGTPILMPITGSYRAPPSATPSTAPVDVDHARRLSPRAERPPRHPVPAQLLRARQQAIIPLERTVRAGMSCVLAATLLDAFKVQYVPADHSPAMGDLVCWLHVHARPRLTNLVDRFSRLQPGVDPARPHGAAVVMEGFANSKDLIAMLNDLSPIFSKRELTGDCTSYASLFLATASDADAAALHLPSIGTAEAIATRVSRQPAPNCFALRYSEDTNVAHVDILTAPLEQTRVPERWLVSSFDAFHRPTAPHSVPIAETNTFYL